MAPVAEPGDFAQPLGPGRQDLGEGAESGDQRLGERLDVPPRHGAEQQQFQQFVIRQAVLRRRC